MPAARLLEGAYSSLLWWEDDTLCVVADTRRCSVGVTRALLLDLAARPASGSGAGAARRRADSPGARSG